MEIEYNLVNGIDVEFTYGVNIKIPRIKEIAKEEFFNTYVNIFIVRTREIFSTLMQVDELTKKYPSLWEIIIDDNMDSQVGKFFGDYESVSQILIEALHYWTGLEKDGEDGFRKINRKIIHTGSEWVIDYKEFKRLCEFIKKVTCFQGYDDNLIAPVIKSPAQYESWMKTYRYRVDKAKKEGVGLGDKMLILSISMDAYIPIEEINNMTVYTFYRLFNALSAKEAYEKKFLMLVSPKYESKKGDTPKHWKEMFKQGIKK